ncbi:hypothetical protein HG263_01600 [Pseudoalteromonas sp. JBTF-M23]|uniref:Uncharacterized protein n=1 Tax=Pseudoalteromonas caenipelagi TaxID=2726988 RepID=A0A849V8I7_9GAMM|nr:hypothetical protein [Pseudoalteromonas caenipelagi]NOU49248.1 hypothetical protein [Pseudoalteromonas caenipelagi]
MKNLFISTAFLLSGTISLSSHANDIDPELQLKLDETYDLYQTGLYRETLDNIKWLNKHAVAIDYNFYLVRLGAVLPLWNSLGEVYEPARKSFIHALNNAIQNTLDSPNNCNAFDDTRLMLDINDKYDEFISLLENKELSYPSVWKRCWDYNMSLTTVEHSSKPLIDAYLVDLSDHFKNTFVPVIDGLYDTCSGLGDYTPICQDDVKVYLNDVSMAFRNAAKDHYGLEEEGQIGGITLKLLLKWQNQSQ